MKKILAIALAAILLLSMTACGSGAPAETEAAAAAEKYVVGVCQLVPHVALDAATQGFVDKLTEILGEENVEIQVKVAAGDGATCAPIVTDFVSQEVDLIMANATPALQSAAAATADIPILGTSVTEYGVAMGIEGFTGTVGGNISGTSDLAPLDKQADMILEWFPEAKNVGLLYCAAEANSKYQVDEVKKYLEAKNLTVKEFSFSSTSDLAAVAEQAAAWSDVIYVPTDNTVANSTSIVDGVCRPKKVPIIAGEEGICTGLGVATLSISYEDLGKTTGEMAAKILKGEAKIGEMPIQYAGEPVAKYNKEICGELGLTVPQGYVAIGD